MKRRAEWIVGIDLGTTNTVAATAPLPESDTGEPAPPTLLPIAQPVGPGRVAEQPLLPSFLYAPLPGEIGDEQPDWVCGELGWRRGREVPGRMIASAKSWLGHSAVERTAAILPWGRSEESDVTPMSPVQASTRLLEGVRRAFQKHFPGRSLADQSVVLTVPASFDQAARQLTVEAAHAAGLTVRLLEEPQAAFYDYMQRAGEAGLEALLNTEGARERGEAMVLVCDIGGGTTDLSLIQVSRGSTGGVDVTRIAVGRHLLLGGDNIDIALAHLCEQRLNQKLEPTRFGQLTLAARQAKERLLADDAPEDVPVTLLASGSQLLGGSLRTTLTRQDVQQIAIDGFFPLASRDAEPQRGRGGLVAFGLPYERDPRITVHLASFFRRHAPDLPAPDAVLFNGGVFYARAIRKRLLETLSAWRGSPILELPLASPDHAVATGAAVFGLAIAGHGMQIGGGAAHGYYIGVESAPGQRRAVCVVPRGAKESERHTITSRALELLIGKPVRFELYATDSGTIDAPGSIVDASEERFELLPPVATTFKAPEGSQASTLRVFLEGELTPVGTLELACVQADDRDRRFALEFELRGTETLIGQASRAPSQRTRSSVGALGQRFDEACEAIQRVFGKGRSDVTPRAVKDLMRDLEKLLGDRPSWDLELTRALFDVVGPKHKARRRSMDHERVYWQLSGYCLRPGFGHPLDPGRIDVLDGLFAQGVQHATETRNWQQFFIAWRRISGGLSEARQIQIGELLAPFLAPAEAKLKKPKSFRPPPVGRELLELAAALERLPADRRAELGRWLLDQTWTDRNPMLWEAIGRIGARVPVYASAHHVVAPRTAERWLDHLLRERWEEMPSAAQAATRMARISGDRARDIPDTVRTEVAKRLEAVQAPTDWIAMVRELVPVEDAERADFFGEALPVGLKLVE